MFQADSIEPRIGYPEWVYNNVSKLAEKYDLVRESHIILNLRNDILKA